ncbi:MAG: hypothetical protein Q9219_004470 [cf. Caloplaca sp. 3 TL-2023]
MSLTSHPKPQLQAYRRHNDTTSGLPAAISFHPRPAASSKKGSHHIAHPSDITSDPAEGHSPAVQANEATRGQHNQRRYQPPAVNASRIVQRPVSNFQKESPREFHIKQLERRFPSLQKGEGNDGETTLSFQLVPSDPDFPFEMTALDCVLHVPTQYPLDGKPFLAVKNADMPRGYQVNVERGFDTLVQQSPRATLLSLTNMLDKQLESLLTGQKAEIIKIVPNVAKGSSIQPQGNAGKVKEAFAEPLVAEKPRKGDIQFTPEQRQNAQARRDPETRQLEARLGRLPLFSKSSDGILFTVPVTPRSLGELPVPLQSVRSVKLFVPELYPLHACRIELPGVSREAARKTEETFNERAKNNSALTLMTHVNYFAQHMHIMATEPETQPETTGEAALPLDHLHLEDKETQQLARPEDDRSHIQIIPRPPEWTVTGEEGSDSDSDSDFSDSYDTGDESDDEHQRHQEGQALESVSEQTAGQPAERGISLSFPSLELYNVELLQLTSLSLAVKCARCKTPSDVPNLQNAAPRPASCSKCAQPFSLNYRSELMHANSYRAGYLDLTGCTVADMLPSTFIPTCATCSTPVAAAPGVVSVRGDAASIAVCRECHGRLTFKIPETKFLLVSNTSLHPRNMLPLRRKKLPRENLGIVAGEELPRRGRCRHYTKSYRWFRFSCCDPRKYKRRPGTRVGGPNKGGIGGGGESAKKT